MMAIGNAADPNSKIRNHLSSVWRRYPRPEYTSIERPLSPLTTLKLYDSTERGAFSSDISWTFLRWVWLGRVEGEVFATRIDAWSISKLAQSHRPTSNHHGQRYGSIRADSDFVVTTTFSLKTISHRHCRLVSPFDFMLMSLMSAEKSVTRWKVRTRVLILRAAWTHLNLFH